MFLPQLFLPRKYSTIITAEQAAQALRLKVGGIPRLSDAKPLHLIQGQVLLALTSLIFKWLA
jgi:hypothetical protein